MNSLYFFSHFDFQRCYAGTPSRMGRVRDSIDLYSICANADKHGLTARWVISSPIVGQLGLFGRSLRDSLLFNWRVICYSVANSLSAVILSFFRSFFERTKGVRGGGRGGCFLFVKLGKFDFSHSRGVEPSLDPFPENSTASLGHR